MRSQSFMLSRLKIVMLRACPTLLAVAVPAAAQLPSNSVPVFIGDERVLVGKYHYEEASDDFKMDVHLNADHTALYRITTGSEQAAFIDLSGYWTLDNPYIHIHNRPGPVRLEPTGTPTRNASVGFSIVAMNADGSPAEGLGVTWDEANALYMLSEGRHTVSPGEIAKATTVEIVRSSDRKILRTVKVAPGEQNSFRFTYYPSDQEPFDIPAIALDPSADTLEVEVGTSQAQLKRVSK
jgi:hypothetical protein